MGSKHVTSEALRALPPPPPRTEGGLYGQATQRGAGRWLWMGGLSENTADGPDLNEWIEGQRNREGGGAALGSFKVHRHAGGAWVHFVVPTFAQWCVQGLNGRELPGGGALRVRYASYYEDTSGPPAVEYVKRPASSAASSRGQVRPRAAGEPVPSAAASKARAEDGGASADGGDSKRLKAEGGASAPGARASVKAEEPKPGSQGAATVPNGSAASACNGNGASSSGGAAARQVHLGAASARAALSAGAKPGAPGQPTWSGTTWTNADVLRLALRSARHCTSSEPLAPSLPPHRSPPPLAFCSSPHFSCRRGGASYAARFCSTEALPLPEMRHAYARGRWPCVHPVQSVGRRRGARRNRALPHARRAAAGANAESGAIPPRSAGADGAA